MHVRPRKSESNELPHTSTGGHFEVRSALRRGVQSSPHEEERQEEEELAEDGGGWTRHVAFPLANPDGWWCIPRERQFTTSGEQQADGHRSFLNVASPYRSEYTFTSDASNLLNDSSGG